jgi:SAM-dependent methyltransferase
MMEMPPAGARVSPSAARNRGPILDVLKAHLPQTGLVVEIAAGTGEHAAHGAQAFPDLRWQPTDFDPGALQSIAAWRLHADLPNLLPPVRLDASDSASWPFERADAIVNINMVHISPWAATEGLIAGAARLLPPGGVLFLYGPFFEAGTATAASNAAFDIDLRERNSAWGLRDLNDVVDLAAGRGLGLSRRVAMPANNLSLVFTRTL